MTNASQMIEQVAEAMWLRTHPDGIWPTDAEKEFGAVGRGISTATIYRQDAGAAVETIGRYIGEVFGQQPSEAAGDEVTEGTSGLSSVGSVSIISPGQGYTTPSAKPDDWKTKRGLR